MELSLTRTALYQMSNKDSKSSSWSVYSYIRLKRYDLNPLDILQNFLSKGDIRRNICSYWFNILTDEAEEKCRLFYFDVMFKVPSRCHTPCLGVSGLKPNRDSQGSHQSKTHIYILYSIQANRATFNWYQVSGQCPRYARVTQKTETTSFYCARLCPSPVIDT